jgi:hypothetical protein
MYNGTAINCTFYDNRVYLNGGGMYGGIAKNSVIYYNSPDNLYSNTPYYCCSPDITNGINSCITNTPLFIDRAAGNLHLPAESPCIDRGNNGYSDTHHDLDHIQRIIDGNSDGSAVVDMGCYEYHGGKSDVDGDRMSGDSESIAGTSADDKNSFFAVSTTNASTAGITVNWSPSVTGRQYSVLWCDNLRSNNFQVIQSGISYPQNSYTDTLHNAAVRGFYKVNVKTN